MTSKKTSEKKKDNKITSFFRSLNLERAHFFQEIEVYTHKHPFVKFAIILFLFLLYFGFTVSEYGFKDGLLTSLLTWSFFVFCTPIADAGILIDFPVRLFANVRMIYSEIRVWIIALSINIYAFAFNQVIYQKNTILQIFKQIITTPWPYGIIILLSAAGTFFSVYFGDEILDVVNKTTVRKKHAKHHLKHEIIVFTFIIVAIIILYYVLIQHLGISIELI